ncbi:MAG: DNA-3-methyladenine glycosylase 2 family protein [Bacillota bacterium]|nr:DNA-3-methyladenine glycosylase 2 family protein [Bacillota bacterium]
MNYQVFEIKKENIESLMDKDSVLRDLIQKYGDLEIQMIPDLFMGLVYNIVFQQISYKAGHTIWSRMEKNFDFTPGCIIEAGLEKIKEQGMSYRKAKYIINVAEYFLENEIELKKLGKYSDETIIEELCKIKGIGNWTAEMVLIFTFGRQNVITFNDLAIKKGIKKLYGLDQIPSKEELVGYHQSWSPYSTIALFYIWEMTKRNDLV